VFQRGTPPVEREHESERFTQPIERLRDHDQPDQRGGNQGCGKSSTHRLPQCAAEFTADGAPPSDGAHSVTHDADGERGEK